INKYYVSCIKVDLCIYQAEDGIRDRNVTGVQTCALPIFEEYGGWESEQVIDDFVNYDIVLFEAFKDKVKYWITMNEQNIFTTLGWMTAQHPPGKFDDEKMYYLVNHHAFLAHAKSVLRFKEIIP